MTLPPHVPAGHTRNATYELEITPADAGWAHAGLRVLDLAPGGVHELHTGPDEVVVLPLAGACTVECDGARFELAGRASVFEAVTDFAYVPRDSRLVITSAGGGRFALASARATRRLAPRHVPAVDVAVELRGSGNASRQVNNFCMPGRFDADRLIAVEVLTPGGNWSSWPPHRHEADTEHESALEEIYYFEVRGDGPAYQRVYTATPGREIDVLAEVHSGDVVLIPFGYHGPSMAAPGYDLYYLNVMAGPGRREWKICDDPAHEWVRSTWPGQPIDPRLPMSGPR